MGGIIDAEMSYSIDGGDSIAVSTTSTFVPVESTITGADGTQTTGPSAFWSYYLISGSVELIALQSGQHSLTVFGNYTRQSKSDETGFAMQTVHFTIDNGSETDTELPTNTTDNTTIYVVIGIFSLIAIVSCALFVKRKSNSKNVDKSNGIN
jgi:hypothetical protein